MSFGCAAALVVGQNFTLRSQAEAFVTSANYFLQIRDPDIVGESTGAGHLNDIDLASFSMSFSRLSDPGGAGGGGSTKGTCGVLRLLKNVDKASPKLVISAMLGTLHNRAVLSGETKDGSVDFRMSLTNVIVLSVNFSDSSGAPPATEEVTLQAQSIVLEVIPVSPKAAGPSTATIDCFGGGGA